MAASAAGFQIFTTSVTVAEPHPFLQFMAANESRQSPIRIKQVALLLPLPWRLGRPRRTLVPLRVQWISQIRGYRFPGANPWLAHIAGDPLYCSGDGERPPIQARGSSSRPLAGLAAAVVTHAKQRVTSKGLRSFKMWKHARASLWASALIATTVFVLAFLRS